jgi:hypothetical protein
VAKVKKVAVVTGVRNVKASNISSKNSGTASPSNPGRTKARKTAGEPVAKRTSAKKAAKNILPPTKAAKKAKVVRTGKVAKHAKAARKKAGSMSKVNSISKARLKASKSAPAPVVRVVVKPLEPQAKCGAGTSVQFLFRVDETVDGRHTTHLVFFDRHGWYCEHGRTCPAVGHAKKYQGHIARAS